MRASILISSFKEPKLERAIKSAINQNTKENYEIVVSAPDKEAKQLVKTYKKNFKNIRYIKDQGKGKSYALNLVFPKLKGELWLLTDGDVFLEENALSNILKEFGDNKIGCVTGRVIPINSKKTLTGYWAHLLADAGANRIRQKLSNQNKFLECTGYLFAFREGFISKIPLNVAEDSYIPFIFYKKNYLIKYAPKAIVYVKNPTNVRDFIKQRIRTAKAHSSLTDYFPDFPKVKSFKNEIKEGTFSALKYPSNIKEFFYTLLLFYIRFYIWIRVFFDDFIINKRYADGWERVKTTK